MPPKCRKHDEHKQFNGSDNLVCVSCERERTDKAYRASKEGRINALIDVLQIKFKRSEKNRAPICQTAWGTKTRLGLEATIKRIMYEDY